MSHGRIACSSRRTRAADGLERVAALAFAALIVALPWRNRIDPFPHPTTMPAPLSEVVLYAIDGLVLVTIAAWIAGRLVRPRPFRFGPPAIVIPALALVALAWLTLPFAVLPALSVFGAVRLTALVVLAAYVISEVRGPASLAIPLGLMIGIEASIAIGQFVTQGSLGLTAIGEVHLNPVLSGVSIVLREDGVRVLRAYGLSTHPNVLGGMLAVAILLLLAARPKNRLGVGLQAAAVALGTGGLLVTFSRGAWLGLGAGLVASLIVLGVAAICRDRRQWLAIGGLALAVGAAGGWLLRDEIAIRSGLAPTEPASEARSIDERLAQIDLGWRVVLERPVTGTGLGGAPVEMQRLDPTFPYAYYPPHLVPLVATAELGLGGGLAVLALLVGPWILLLRSRGRWKRELAAASGALLAVTVVGLLDYYPWVGGPGRTLFWVVLALWVGTWLRAGSVDDAGPGVLIEVGRGP